MRILKRAVLVCVVVFILLAVVLGASVLLSDDVAWRFTVLKAKLSGKIPEIPLPQLIKWMRPGSAVYVGGLARTSNVNASIVNLHNDRQSAEAGSRVYGRICIECHGDDANGRTGPSLIAAAHYLTDWKMFSTVKWGRPKTIMMPQPLSDLEIWQVCAFIRKTAADHDTGDKAKREQLPPFQPRQANSDHSVQCSAPASCLGGPTASRQSLSRVFPHRYLQPHVRYRSAGGFDRP
jgi:mono/diheme cytochrome c family protein